MFLYNIALRDIGTFAEYVQSLSRRNGSLVSVFLIDHL